LRAREVPTIALIQCEAHVYDRSRNILWIGMKDIVCNLEVHIRTLQCRNFADSLDVESCAEWGWKRDNITKQSRFYNHDSKGEGVVMAETCRDCGHIVGAFQNPVCELNYKIGIKPGYATIVDKDPNGEPINKDICKDFAVPKKRSI
jgi:hypothetical protein